MSDRPAQAGWVGDVWGGLAAALVALPSAIAFGVAIYAPLGASQAAQGAIAGVVGTIALGLVAPALGDAKRLISTPCAPAAAVLSALALELSGKGLSPDTAIVMLTLVALVCGGFQVLFGAVGLGRLIKYMPYPVVSGYLTGVGLLILTSQVPKWLGAPKGTSFWHALATPSIWRWQSLAVGAATTAVMVLAPKLTKAVPAPVLALAAGLATYFGLAAADRSLLALSHNTMVIGPLGATAADLLPAMMSRWKAIAHVPLNQAGMLISAALSLSVLLSIDTLKTCVVLDTITRQRHNSNKELTGQGFGNLASAMAGGVPGAGASGPTMVNLFAGAQSQMSGIAAGGFALLIFLVLGQLIAWLPIAALAGILIVVGFRMCHFDTLHLLRSRSTWLDFLVIATVIFVALKVELIVASAAGVALAILLFLREQIGGSVVHNKSYGNVMFSKQVRGEEEMRVLEQHGHRATIFELQGSLFFGTTDQLYTAIEPELKTRDWVILDMRRVRSVDFTAVHCLELIGDILAERGAELIFSHFPRAAPTGQDVERYLQQAGLVRSERRVRVFAHLSDALEHVEGEILREAQVVHTSGPPLELRDFALFRGRKEETLGALEQCMEKRSYAPGETIFTHGDTTDELFLIRRGEVHAILPLKSGPGHHLATFRRGDFLGEMAFLDQAPRSANAVAVTDTDLYVLSRSRFNALAEEHKRLGMRLLEGIARVLAHRLRRADRELRAFHEG